MPESKQLKVQYLLLIQDEQGKRKVYLEPTHHSIGRGLNNSIVLNCHQVSRQHAMLLRVMNPNSTSYFFRLVDGDLQGKPSTNGVFVNNQRCFSHDLKHKDKINFGGGCIATYYNTLELSELEELEFCQTKINSSLLSSSVNSSTTLIDPNIEPENSLEAALTRLASFPEILSNPIIEITLGGTITYINSVAVEHFPDILELKSQHVILAGLLSDLPLDQDKSFVRQVQYHHRTYQQSVCYKAENQLLRTYITDITQQKQLEAVRQHLKDEIEIIVEHRTKELRESNSKLQVELREKHQMLMSLNQANAALKIKVQQLATNLFDSNQLLQSEIFKRQQAEEILKTRQNQGNLVLLSFQKLFSRLSDWVKLE